MSAAMSQGTLNAVRTLLVVGTALLGGTISVRAQQSESSAPSAASLERIRDALQSPQHLISSDGVPLIGPSKPDEVQLGILTFVPPDTPGQVVSIRVPVGALASRAVHAVVAAHHRRAENSARDEVEKAFAEFQRAQPK
jgi:hypothetical protein